MRNRILLSAVAAALTFAAAAQAQAQVPYPQGVGPVISGTVTNGRLPKGVREFAKKLYPQAGIVSAQEDFMEKEFGVTLDNGVEMEFDAAGRWLEVEAPQGRCLDEATVKTLVPDRAYNELLRLKLAASVDDVKRSDTSYKVGIDSADIDDLRFDAQGLLVDIEI